MSKTQEWFRSYSGRLANSYLASKSIEHRVTKGSSRETQVLDLLSSVLPLRTSVLHSGGVIIDSRDQEAPSFDALLVDRQNWPLLFQQDNLSVAMVESVIAAVEIKSDLATHDIEDIMSKASQLGRLSAANRDSPLRAPVVVAFAYSCPNSHLAFFDFAMNYAADPTRSPTLICVLNSSVFFLGRTDGANLVPSDAATPGLVPAMFHAKEDSLLIFLYLLSKLAALGSPTVETLLAYAPSIFGSAIASHYDQDFFSGVMGDSAKSLAVRESLKGKADRSFSEVYAQARQSIGLS